MSENTYRSKENTPKEEPKVAEKKTSSASTPRFSLAFLKDKRLHFLFGTTLLLFSLFCLIAFISYVVNGTEDQSVVESVGETGLIESGMQTSNALGLFGAWVSNLFIYKWFGLGAFCFVPIFALIGYRIVFKKQVQDYNQHLRTFSFGALWMSIFFGYLFNLLELSPKYSFLGGGIGYDLSIWFESLVGWGTGVFIIFTLVVFLIFNFNIVPAEAPVEEEVEETEEEDDDSDAQFFPEGDKPEEEQPDEPFDDRIEVTVVPPPLDSDEKKNDLIEPDDIEIKDFEDDTDNEIPLSITPLAKPLANNYTFEIAETSEPKVAEINPVTEPISRVDETSLYDPTLDLSHYQFPTVDLLNDYGGEQSISVNKAELEANKDRIVDTLRNYKIEIASIKATIGPTVTLYEIVPEAGIRISKIKSLEDDIALSLSALGIRIIAPIPGKGTIGIEVPNSKPEMVSMHSIINSEKFRNANMDLPIALGKTISNEIFITDLAKMPHLLMAGATGQGKSVGLNAILTSLLYKKHPSQLKFVMVDPKKVELSIYNKIEKHFLAKLPDSEESIITDTSKVVNTLNSLCIEMDTRYALLKDAECRNLKEYNEKFVKRKLSPNDGHRFLPFIVLIIDELADLMMTAGKEVETPIARLAQLARAIGIHLIVATQRPSVNVITGIIKANFPARLSFKVTSKIDSRTILDTGGADQLIGKGDMLLSHNSDLIRIQCAFVDTPECDRITEFISSQQGYPDAYLLPEFLGDDSNGMDGDFDMDDKDSMFDEAAYLIVRNQQGSTSLIQRKLKLGYNRAGRIMDQLEAAGIVGPSQGSKAREVLIHDEYSLEQFLNNLNSNN